MFAKNLQIQGEATIKTIGFARRIVLDGSVLITGPTTFIASNCNAANIQTQTIRSTSSDPYNDALYLNSNVVSNPNRIDFEDTDVTFNKNIRVYGSIFISSMSQIKVWTGSVQTGPFITYYDLNQAIESSAPDLSGINNSIALISSQLGAFTITQFTTFSNSIPTTYVAKSLFDSTIAAYQLQINNTNKLSYNFISGTPDLSVYANISGPKFTSDVKLLETKILYVDNIAPKTTSPTNIKNIF